MMTGAGSKKFQFSGLGWRPFGMFAHVDLESGKGFLAEGYA